MSRLHPPPEVLEIAARLRRAGFEAWCVGGAVRDALLGHAHLDWDLATSATPPEVMRTFKRTVPVGIAFGTVGVLDANGRLHEVTTFRHDVKTDGRHAEVQFGASLEEDLARRDFTINAIAYNPHTGELLDPFFGRKDLRAKLVRCVGDAEQRMKEDRLRALRALRFAARFDFTIDPSTWKAICNSAPHLTRLSAERVKQEIEKTMEQVTRPSAAFANWRDAGALRVLVGPLHDAPAERFAALDHLSLPKGKRAGERKLLRLAMLFFGDDKRAAEGTLKDLRFSNHDVAWVSRLAEARARLGDAVDAAMLRDGGPSDAELRRWAAAVGRTASASWWRLTAALYHARRAQEVAHTNGEGADGEPSSLEEGSRKSAPRAPNGSRKSAPSAKMSASVYRRLLRIAYRDAIEIGDLQVDGEDLASAGIPKGPQLGTTLKRLLEAVIENPALNTRDALLRIARAEREIGGEGAAQKTSSQQ
ncbi:MAG: CCA tRNA nucleotidyltransferase [Candidatus Omnitrophota bacterium]|jgi:tRNA nucleotidyltransferase (CCA-adding enzyme)